MDFGRESPLSPVQYTSLHCSVRRYTTDRVCTTRRICKRTASVAERMNLHPFAVSQGNFNKPIRVMDWHARAPFSVKPDPPPHPHSPCCVYDSDRRRPLTRVWSISAHVYKCMSLMPRLLDHVKNQPLLLSFAVSPVSKVSLDEYCSTTHSAPL